MNLAVLGINFKTAPVAIREKASFSAQEVPAALQALAAAFPGAEWVLVSTCNRTELYLAGVDVPRHKRALIRTLLKGANDADADAAAPHFYEKADMDAAQHLLAVSSSLDSMVVGEAEILGQVKSAYTLACEARTHGKWLSPLFHNAFRCAKRVHSETAICHGRVSVSSLAVEFAEKVFEDLGAKTVMIVGAGETAELSLKSIVERGARDVLVLNRSLDKAQALAERYGGRAIQFDLLDDYLPRADIVISSTSAPHVIIRAESVRKAMAIRRGRPALLIDIAMPRDIDPAAAEIPDVYLYHIDDLQRVAAANLARRQEAVDQAWEIVLAATAEIQDQFRIRGVGDTMRRLDEHGKGICDTLLKKMLAKEKLAALPEPCREEIRILAHRIASTLLAGPKDALQRAAKDGRGDACARTVAELFRLEGGEQPGVDAKPGDGSGKCPCRPADRKTNT